MKAKFSLLYNKSNQRVNIAMPVLVASESGPRLPVRGWGGKGAGDDFPSTKSTVTSAPADVSRETSTSTSSIFSISPSTSLSSLSSSTLCFVESKEPIDIRELFRHSVYVGLSDEYYMRRASSACDGALSLENKRLLYVMQSEIACNVDANDFDIIASDDATTCHIIIAISRISKKILLTHADCPEQANTLVKDYLETLGDSREEDVDVYIVGGLDDEHLSLEISKSLIGELSRSSRNYYLQLFSTCDLNIQDKSKSPFSRCKAFGCGLLIDRLTSPSSLSSIDSHSSSTQFSFTCLPINIPSARRGPEYLLRKCRSAPHRSKFTVLYDGRSNRGKISIAYFTHQPELVGPLLLQILQLPDDEILNNFSTSPHCEPDHFVPEFKEFLLFASKAKNVEDRFSSGSRNKSNSRNNSSTSNKSSCNDNGSVNSVFAANTSNPKTLEFIMNPDGLWA